MEKQSSLLEIVIKRRIIVILFIIASIIIGIVYGFVILPTIYEATAKIIVEHPGKLIDYKGNKNDFLDIQAKLITTRPVAERAVTKLYSHPDAESGQTDRINTDPNAALTMMNRIQTKIDRKNDMIEISARGGNANECAYVVNAYAHAFVEASTEIVKNSIQANIAETSALLDSAEKDYKKKEAALARAGGGNTRLKLEVDASKKFFDETYERLQYLKNDKERFDVKMVVFDEAAVPSVPISPDRKKILTVAEIIGLIAGCAAAYYIEKKSDAKTA